MDKSIDELLETKGNPGAGRKVLISGGPGNGKYSWVHAGLSFKTIVDVEEWFEEGGIIEYLKFCIVEQVPFPKTLKVYVNKKNYTTIQFEVDPTQVTFEPNGFDRGDL